MKKLLGLILAAAVGLSTLTGCGAKSDAGAGGTAEMKDGQTVQTVVDQINDEVGIAMPGDIDDTAMETLFYLDPEKDVEEYAGKMSLVMVSADNVMAVKAKPDRAQAVADGLNKRLADVRQSFEQYLPEQKEKADKGQVIQKGDYVFLVVIGESADTFDADMEKAVSIINNAF